MHRQWITWRERKYPRAPFEMDKNKSVAKGENLPSNICARRRLKSACPSAQSDHNLRCPHEETLHPWLSKMRPVKILIRLRECAGWSESPLGAHVRRYFSWRFHILIQYKIAIQIQKLEESNMMLHTTVRDFPKRFWYLCLKECPLWVIKDARFTQPAIWTDWRWKRMATIKSRKLQGNYSRQKEYIWINLNINSVYLGVGIFIRGKMKCIRSYLSSK